MSPELHQDRNNPTTTSQGSFTTSLAGTWMCPARRIPGGHHNLLQPGDAKHTARPPYPNLSPLSGLGTVPKGPRDPVPSRVVPPLAPPGCLLTQVPLPHPGMLVLGPRQCGNRIRAARQRLSTPAKECERLRRGEGARPGHHRGIPLAPCWERANPS